MIGKQKNIEIKHDKEKKVEDPSKIRIPGISRI